MSVERGKQRVVDRIVNTTRENGGRPMSPDKARKVVEESLRRHDRKKREQGR